METTKTINIPASIVPAGALVLSDTPLFELPQALFSNTPAVIKEVLKIALKEATAEEKRSFLSLSNAYRGIPWNEMKEEDGIQSTCYHASEAYILVPGLTILESCSTPRPFKRNIS